MKKSDSLATKSQPSNPNPPAVSPPYQKQMERWQCMVCGHRMTEEESKGYRGCPTGVHAVKHELLLKSELENAVRLLQHRAAFEPANAGRNALIVYLEKLRDEIEVDNDAKIIQRRNYPTA
jgi:hypothetical protein